MVVGGRNGIDGDLDPVHEFRFIVRIIIVGRYGNVNAKANPARIFVSKPIPPLAGELAISTALPKLLAP